MRRRERSNWKTYYQEPVASISFCIINTEDEVDSAPEQVTVTRHSLKTTPSDAPQTATLGPVPKAMLQVEGVHVEALVDNGAPVSIINLILL